MVMSQTLLTRLASLVCAEAQRQQKRPVAVAFSGGIDSRFLCFALQQAGLSVLALHAHGVHVSSEETHFAQTWAAQQGIPLLLVPFAPLEVREVRENGKQRCYFCKRALISCLLQALQEHGEGERLLCEGSNADDRTTFRPGRRALEEANIFSPLAVAGVSKAELRAAAAATGMAWPEQVSRPCLLTRFAYGLSPTAEQLERLGALEAELALLSEGGVSLLGDFRVRLMPEPVLQAQHLPQAALVSLDKIMKRHGFSSWQGQEMASVSGFYDALLP